MFYEAVVARLYAGGDDGSEGNAVEFREHNDWGEPMNWKERIVIDPTVLVGKPIIRGTRMAVEFIVELLAEGWTHEQILSNYPQLIDDDIQAALCYASEMLKQEKVYPHSV